MLHITKRKSQKAAVSAREYPESWYIPYKCHWNRNTIMTKDRELLQIIKLEGFSFETADDDDLDMRKNIRNSLWRSIASGNYALWFHTVRRRKPVYVGGEQPEGFASKVDKAWGEKHQGKNSFVNELYVTVVYKEDSEWFAKLEHSFNKMLNKADKEVWEHSIKEAYKNLEDITSRIISTLKDYKPRLLGIYQNERGVFSELLEFLGMLVNGGIQKPVQVPTIDIAQYLPTNRLYFGRRALEVCGVDQDRFAGMVSVKEYAHTTSSGILDSFLQLPFEFIMTQSFSFSSRQSAILSMQNQQRRMQASGDVAVSQMIEISNAVDLAMSGHIAFGNHHMSILCFGEDVNAVEKNVSLVSSELVNVGITPVSETTNMQAAYWAQLPANFDFVARKSIINSLNLSGFASLHNYPTGKKTGNHWGDAVTILDTSSGTPYYFNFHVRDVGHTTIIGPTGAGKTVLMNFLCAQAQKFNARMFFFDKDRGAEIFIRALGGKFSGIEPGVPSGFNPLQLEDTFENRSFLEEWLRSLATTRDQEVTVDDMQKITDAINGNYTLRQEDRRLSNIMPFFGLEGPGTLATRMKQWCEGEPRGALFDNEQDILDLTDGKIFGFEMGEVLQDGVSLGPALLYLFHRISMSLDGTPTIIVLDEAWALIDNPFFAPKIKNWLKTLRKLNAMVVFATQSVEDASKSDISDTLIQQTATQIFLLNPKATEEYRKVFMLSEREFSLIRGTDPSSRYFLVKQDTNVVIARVDLSSMMDIVHVLSGRAETVGLLDEIRAEVGDDPDDWMPIFLKKVKNVA